MGKMKLEFPKDFLWGGGIADFQAEGGYEESGRGLTTLDFVTQGSATEPRKITYMMPDGSKHVQNARGLPMPEHARDTWTRTTIIPASTRWIFITTTKRIFGSLPRWGCAFSGSLSAGPGSFPPVWRKRPMRPAGLLRERCG